MSGLKTGAEAAQAAQKAAAEQANFVNRFWMPADPNKTVRVTFLDGDIDPATGELAPNPSRYEHNVQMNGNWRNWFNCVAEDQPCPICLRGNDYKPSYVTYFTVMNHTPYHSKKHSKEIVNNKYLYACKVATLKQLGFIAKQQTTLKGLTIDIARLDQLSASVGSMFNVVSNHKTGNGPSFVDVCHGQVMKDLAAIDYGKVLKFHTAEELAQIFGNNFQQDSQHQGVPAAAGQQPMNQQPMQGQTVQPQQQPQQQQPQQNNSSDGGGDFQF